jgi:hypothetical protein
VSPYIHKTAAEKNLFKATIIRDGLASPQMKKFWRIVPEGEQLKVFRGQPNPEFDASYSPVISTSSSPLVAYGFMRIHDNKLKRPVSRCCLFEIRVQPGIHYIHVGSVLGEGGKYNEAEIILEGGQTLRRIGEEKIESKDKKYFIKNLYTNMRQKCQLILVNMKL